MTGPEPEPCPLYIAFAVGTLILTHSLDHPTHVTLGPTQTICAFEYYCTTSEFKLNFPSYITGRQFCIHIMARNAEPFFCDFVLSLFKNCTSKIVYAVRELKEIGMNSPEGIRVQLGD